jgi:hypothetical protein
MSKENGFVPLRRGIWEHVRDGGLTHTGALIYIYMLSQADTRTGIWKGSAQCLASALNIPKSTAKYSLRRLDGKYIQRFTTPGRHVCYPILLHKFLITQGQHIGLMLDAVNSRDERTLEFYKPGDSQQAVGQVLQHVAPQRIKEKRERRSKTGKPPADSRFGPFLELARASFESKYGRPPTWDCCGKDGAALAAFLRRASHITLEIWQAHIRDFFDSTEAFTVKQGGGLAYFVSRFDTFSSGPILEGGSNGKVTSFSERRSQKAATAISTVLGRLEKASGDIHGTLPPANE